MIDVNQEHEIMREEIFGPILPFITVSNHIDAIDFISQRCQFLNKTSRKFPEGYRKKALTLAYVYFKNQKVSTAILYRFL